MRPYVKIARLDHWIKQFFIVPGIVIALFMTRGLNDLSLPGIAGRCIIGFFATCCIASANYVINEWLDAKFDKYHPTKKNRPVVTENLNKKIVAMEYVGLSIVGFLLAFLVSKAFLAVIATFLIYMLCRNGRKRCDCSLQLLFVALYPIGWIFIIYEHSQHYWVANIISIFVYAIFTLFVSHIDEKKNDEGKDLV